MATAALSLESRGFCVSLSGCPGAAGSPGTGESLGDATARLREAGCPARSQRLFGPACCSPCSKLRGDRGSPRLAALLCPVLSASGTDRL